VFVTVRPHKRFTRQGDDLLTEIKLNIVQAALGAEVEVPTLDGKAGLTVPEGTQTGTRFRLRGKGMPHLRGHGRGDLHVVVSVETPTQLSERQRELLRELGRTFGDKAEDKGFFRKVRDALGR
jgi:molecular chaperone DnaJ